MRSFNMTKFFSPVAVPRFKGGVMGVLMGVVACGGLASTTPASAGLTLTLAGTTDGFGLTTFITGDTGNYPALTAANASDGTMLVGSDVHNAIYKFNDVDSQALPANALNVHATPGDPVMASLGGTVYAAIVGGSYLQINTDGSINQTLALTPSITSSLGFWANPVTGHLLSASTSGIVDINPIALTDSLVESSVLTVDGVTVSPDGKTVYGADFGNNHVLGWDILSGSLVFDSGLIPNAGIDGLAVVSGTCSVAGDIVVNNNDGTVGLIDPTTKAYSVIADSGSRGDFVSPDKSNGSLLVSQFDRLMRLTPSTGCSIGSTVPEPDDFALFALGLTALAVIRRRREVGQMSRPAQRAT